jgi:hypothetical protein
MTPEIRAFEFALGLFAVLIGLAVADIATSFHRLVRLRTRVSWDPLTLLAAVYVLLLAVAMWFDLWGVRNFAAVRHFLFYLAIVADLFVLFLLAASSLPDDAQESVDLRGYYAENRRYFWTLASLNQLGYLLLGLCITLGASLVISLVLLFAKSRGVHYAGLILLILIALFHYWYAAIG